ncbi:hypothetical protein JTT01_20220 [Clostridium botulinum]|nr:hypothetical protein [Clostridium botulinum]MCS4465879.1 hypothetical protein [Clostridium botulinum]MCS4524559.1 hypothetical protein [Clostridium botulinum]
MYIYNWYIIIISYFLCKELQASAISLGVIKNIILGGFFKNNNFLTTPSVVIDASNGFSILSLTENSKKTKSGL